MTINLAHGTNAFRVEDGDFDPQMALDENNWEQKWHIDTLTDAHTHTSIHTRAHTHTLCVIVHPASKIRKIKETPTALSQNFAGKKRKRREIPKKKAHNIITTNNNLIYNKKKYNNIIILI